MYNNLKKKEYIWRCCFIHILNIILYIFLGLLVVLYFYILLSNRKKTSNFFGRKKKLIEIVNKNLNITSRAIRKIENAVKEMGMLFYKNGEIDYETLLDTLVLVKKENEDERFASTIDVFIESIRAENPYLHVSNESSELFKQLDYDIKKKDYDKASINLNLLYKKSVEIERSLKHRGKIEFWIGTAIGLVGIAISCVSSFIK